MENINEIIDFATIVLLGAGVIFLSYTIRNLAKEIEDVYKHMRDMLALNHMLATRLQALERQQGHWQPDEQENSDAIH